MPSEHALSLCSSSQSVTSEYAKTPNAQIHKIASALVKSWHKNGSISTTEATADERSSTRDKAAACGKFSSRPSDLFLDIYDDVLSTLDKDPLVGLVSPPLLASSGVIPLSIISVIPDIMRHYAELIVQATTEVFIATNFWQDSHSSRIIAGSLRELSRRTPSSKKIVVKLMYDRGTPAQFLNNRAFVKPQLWNKVGLPKQEEIPNIALEVINYHRPPLGTFHAKYLIVDRRVACLNSNNIQDRPNVEMMIHLEGPIVDSFYDMALLSWFNAMTPPLPLLSHTPRHPSQYQFKKDNQYLRYIDMDFASRASRALLSKQHDEAERSIDTHSPAGSPGDIAAEMARKAANIHGGDGGLLGKNEAVGQHPNMMVPTYAANGSDGREVDSSRDGGNCSTAEANSQVGDAEKQSSLAVPWKPSLSNKDRLKLISDHLNSGNLLVDPTASDESMLHDFMPHILHEHHDPVPMVLVNRQPKGTPGHGGMHKVPQNVAWLSAMRHAQHNVFIQTPTFNASPVIQAAVEACRRSVEVTLYLDLGFNDLGEMIPFQGGTNEQVVHQMYRRLNAEGKQKYLKVYWYTAKDQSEPMSATAKKRNCHVKFMSIDNEIAIVGNGNQDTQSWFHSQEINVMVDSRELVSEWLTGLNANQNTMLHGLVDNRDGVWRDSGGRVVQSSGIKSAGLFGGLKGFTGAIARVRGTGGF